MSEFDITETLMPASDQLDAIELVSGPRTFEVERVSQGSSEQPVQVHLVDFPRPWRPGKSMRRVLAAGWGNDAGRWVGHKVELYFEPEVSFGKEKPGGTRIKRMSHIDGPLSVPLLVSRGKSATYVVEPLTESDPPSAEDWAAKIAASDSIVELRQWWQIATAANRKLIEKRVKTIEAAALGGDE
jgi:hypothetical protein